MEFDFYKSTYRRVYTGLLVGDRINGVSVEAEAMFVRILLAVDDFGNMAGKSVAVACAVFPRRESLWPRVQEFLDELATAKLILPYIVNSINYLHVIGFEATQPATNKNGRRRKLCPLSPMNDGSGESEGCPGDSKGNAGESKGRPAIPSPSPSPLPEPGLIALSDSRKPDGKTDVRTLKGGETRRRDDEKEFGAAIGALLRFGFSATESRELVERHGPKSVADAIRKTQERQRKVPIGDFAAYIRTVIAKGGAK